MVVRVGSIGTFGSSPESKAAEKERAATTSTAKVTTPTLAGPQEPGAQPTIQPQPTPEQQPQQQPSLWSKATDWVGNKLRQATGQLSLEAERTISGREPEGTSLNRLLAIGATAGMGIAGPFGNVPGLIATSGIATKGSKVAWNLYKTQSIKTGPFRTFGAGRIGNAIAANPKSTSNLVKYGVGLGIPIVASLYLADKFLGSWSMAGFQESEAGDPLGIVKYELSKKKQYDLLQEVSAFEDGLLGVEGGEEGWWEKFTDLMPWVNVRKESLKKVQAQRKAREIWDELARRIGAGEIKTVSEEIIATQKIVQEMEIETSRLVSENILAINAIMISRKADAAEDEMLMWEDYKKRMLALEAEERERIAAFWLEYIRQKQKLLADYGRSHLTFGLLR